MSIILNIFSYVKFISSVKIRNFLFLVFVRIKALIIKLKCRAKKMLFKNIFKF